MIPVFQQLLSISPEYGRSHQAIIKEAKKAFLRILFEQPDDCEAILAAWVVQSDNAYDIVPQALHEQHVAKIREYKYKAVNPILAQVFTLLERR